jgi:hypothetical protein
MNPESEKLTTRAEAGTKSIPEGFYNPETERIPVPRTVAARYLTKLVAILVPGHVNTAEITNKHQVDVITGDFQETLVPTKGRIKDEFTALINPHLLRLEDIGFGDCRGFSSEKNIENFTITDEEKILFNVLYTPWKYGPDGTVIPTVDIETLRKAVVELPDETELEQGTKRQAELYVDMVEASIQEEMLRPVDDLADSLDEPNFEHLEILQDTLGQITDKMIEQALAITSIPEANKNSGDRALMRSLISPLMILMKSMYKNTKIGADFDHTKYPEFWQLVDRYHQINCAIGSSHGSKNLIVHEVAYPKLHV